RAAAPRGGRIGACRARVRARLTRARDNVMGEALGIGIGAVVGLLSSTAFVLTVFIGFCVLLGFTKTKRTAGNAPVIKSLDERISHRPVNYLPPTVPRGPADQLKAPELLEAAARKS